MTIHMVRTVVILRMVQTVVMVVVHYMDMLLIIIATCMYTCTDGLEDVSEKSGRISVKGKQIMNSII